MGDALINSVNETLKEEVKKSSPEGMMVAYVGLVVMALLPILFGSYRSVRYQKHQLETGNRSDTMSSKDVALFPLIASGALLGLYIVFKVFRQDYINLLLTSYFFVLGIMALTNVITPFLKFIDQYLPKEKYHLQVGKTKDNTYSELYSVVWHYSGVVSGAISLVFCGWYLFKKHWIANDLLGIAFSLNGIELLQLNSVVNGCILLGGLFVYDVFWVFGTDVMVTVAKSFEAPIKLMFPQDLPEQGLAGSNFAILGLGDIVIPGIFLALLLRFDTSLKRRVPAYFITGFLAYILGLITTIAIMYYYKHAQPALLYLVPLCLGLPISLALLRGDISLMFQYKDSPSEEELETAKQAAAAAQEEAKSKAE